MIFVLWRISKYSTDSQISVKIKMRACIFIFLKDSNHLNFVFMIQ